VDEPFHLAQVNIARMIAPFDSPELASFAALLDEINALADASDGFVWRLQGGEGNATYLRPYDDDFILLNMSVWTSIDALKAYAYQSAHADVMRRRREWFSRFEQPTATLWWVRAGDIPTAGEAVARLEYLRVHGPTCFAFTFKTTYPASADGLVLPGNRRARPCAAGSIADE